MKILGYKIRNNTFNKAIKIIISIVIFLMVYLLFFKNNLIPEVMLEEVLPFYKINYDTKIYGSDTGLNNGIIPLTYVTHDEFKQNVETLENSINQENNSHLINTENVEYKSEEYYSIPNHFDSSVSRAVVEKNGDLNYLRNNFYIVDEKTDLSSKYFDVNNFLNADVTLTDKGTKNEPRVLIFNTHGSEKYKDSKDNSEGVQGLGVELARILNEDYQISTIYHEGLYDVVDGQTQVYGAYERMEEDISKILEQYPSIECTIDIHRDGIPEEKKLVTTIDGKQTAQIMFVNGLSMIYEDNQLTPISSLPNNNLASNLALSFNMKLTANELYPGLTRKIYLHAYRYSLHFKPLSMLVEVGAQTNTYEEAKNAMKPLADIIATTIIK